MGGSRRGGKKIKFIIAQNKKYIQELWTFTTTTYRYIETQTTLYCNINVCGWR